MITVPDPMEAPAIRWGILGPGHIARRFAQEVPSYTHSRIVAVGSRDIGRAAAFAAECLTPEARVYGSYEDLVADPDVDAIYICTPHSEHKNNALLALRAGKPVLVEKAFALNARQACAVFDEANARGLFAMEAMWSRFLPHYAAMRQVLESGELGEVTSIVGCHAQALNMDPSWRMMNPALGGGALLDLGIYPLSLIQWLWGRPDRIRATGVLTSTGVDLRENITLWYGDRLAMAYADMGATGKNSLQIVGHRGCLEIADWFYTPEDLVLDLPGSEPRVIPGKVPGGFQYEAAEVARCISVGRRESSVMPWASTVEVLQITDEVRSQLGVVFPNED